MRITPGMIKVESPLPFNVYQEDGVLLMRQGVVIFNQSQIDSICTRECYTTPHGPNEPEIEARPQQTATEYVEDLIYRIDIAYNDFVTNGYNLVNDIMRIAVEVVSHLEKDPDTLIGVVHIRSDLKYSLIRTIQNTVFAVLTAQHLKWQRKRVVKLACASLTANLGMYPLQDELAEQDTPLQEWQSRLIQKHPAQTVRMLVAMGVKDKEWLYAVGHHHERSDGSGYPNGLTNDKICEEARIMAIVDRYGSAISPRAGRKPSNPQDVMRLFLDREKSLYDTQIAHHFIAEIGVYPPGIAVLLRTGEIGLVTHRRSKRTTPVVQAVWDRNRTPLERPEERDTIFPQYAVIEAIHHEDVARLNADLFWEDLEEEQRRALSLFRSEVVHHGVTAQEEGEDDITLF